MMYHYVLPQLYFVLTNILTWIHQFTKLCASFIIVKNVFIIFFRKNSLSTDEVLFGNLIAGFGRLQ